MTLLSLAAGAPLATIPKTTLEQIEELKQLVDELRRDLAKLTGDNAQIRDRLDHVERPKDD